MLGKSDVDVNRLIEAKEAVLRNTEEYKGRSEKELRALAYSEAVAEMMEPVLTDTDAISRISQKIKQQDRSLWGKIKDFIKGIVEKLKAAYRDMEPDSAIARLTRETVTNSEAVLDAFSEAAADAVLNYNLQETAKENGLRYSDYTFTNRNGESVDYLKSARITDKETLDFLNDQETVTTYKTMQLVDGKLYPPMAAVIQGSYEDASELGKWEMAVEHPELIKDVNGKAKFTLNKGKGQGSLAAAYNPYMHSSNLVLNDQFSGAYLRPNLVTVECKVPVSELTSGYKAQYAKDSVGWHSWHTGTVAGALRQQTGVERQVLLSRYIMPVRILSNAEVAGMYAELLNGTGIAVPDNVVPPALLAELKKAGVTIRESGKVQEEGQKNNAREGVQYSLRGQTQQEITERYQQEVDQVLNAPYADSRQLLVGYTPSVYQELGMPSLPLTIGSGHVYSTAKTEAQARQDGNYKRGVHYHGLGDAAVKNIYNAIQDPVMIIAAKDVNKNASPMRSTHSVVAIVDIGTAGKSLLVPIEITAERKVNGTQMDVNTISSVYERNVSNLVKEAIALENSGDVGVYYAKKEALTLPVAGVRFPVQLQQSIASNSIVHMFSEKVNMKISENTQSQQFKRWFGDWQNDPASASKVVNADGTPKVMYHGTNAEFTVFDRSKGKKKIHLNVLGDGNYFTASEQGAARYGENVIPVYLNIKNPYVKADGFNTVADQIASEFGIARDSFTGKDVSSILRQRGYDGVVMYDGNGEIVIANAFDSTQIKSATDNVGTFDGSNPDIRYSSRDSEYLNLAQNPEKNREALSRMVENAARDAGYDSPMLYHGTQSFGFTNFDLDKMDDKRSIFLTSNPDIAATYSGVDGSRNIGKASGTDISTLSLQEVAQMMNQFPPESGMDYQYSVVESKAEISGQVDRGLNELNNLINTLKKQYGKDSKEYGRLEKLQNTLHLGTNDGLSTQLWMILKQTDLFKGHEDFVNGLEQNLRLLKKAPESGSFLVEKALGGYSIDVLSEADAKEELAQNMQRGNYALYARLGNTLTVEGEGQRWNNLKNWAKGMEVDENSTYVMEDDGKFFLLRKTDDSVVENGVIDATEKARELSPDALQFLLIQKANTSLRILTEVATTTRDVTRWAKNAGYDSVIFKNIKDSGGQNNSVSMDTTADIYAIFNPNNAKSADAVTYDDNGDVIPLSRRFDTGKEDIRYSARNPQAQVEAENERLKSDVKRQIAEAVREYRRQQDVQSKAYRQMYERQLEEVKKKYEKFRSQAESLSSESTMQYQNEFYNALMGTENLGKAKIPELRKKFRELAVENSGKDMDARKARQTEYTRLLDEFQTSRDIGKLRTTIQEQRDRAKAKVEAARVTEQRGKLYRAVNEINRRLLNPTKTLYVPDSLAPAVTKFMQGLTEAMESPKNSWNVQGALETLQGQYQKLTQMNEGVFTQEYNQGILDLLDNAINAVGGTDFNKLSASQIEDVYSAVRSVLTAIRNENKMFAANLNKTYAEAAEAVRREEAALPNRKPTTGAVQDKAEKFGWNQLKPVYAMMRLGSDTLLKQYNNLRAGEDKWQRVIAAARAYGLGTMAKYNYDQWDDSLMKLETETGTVELSLQERMSLYAYARREQAFEHLTKGGFVLSDKNTRTVKNRFGIKTEQT